MNLSCVYVWGLIQKCLIPAVDDNTIAMVDRGLIHTTGINHRCAIIIYSIIQPCLDPSRCKITAKGTFLSIRSNVSRSISRAHRTRAYVLADALVRSPRKIYTPIVKITIEAFFTIEASQKHVIWFWKRNHYILHKLSPNINLFVAVNKLWLSFVD